ncbi:MAG TPA: Mov34/MPN/PAD-1 family protein [Planctomycetota bacterium]|nr:Mov34/MPN/PAD-1 family protein [Planctomycetota bacterium]
MSRKNKNRMKSHDDGKPSDRAGSEKDRAEQAAAAESVRSSEWRDQQRDVQWREFPGPAGVDEPLRVAFTREAYAEIVSHAKEHLDVEACGVLAGRFFEDDAGEFVMVEAAVRGESAHQGGAHVTYTQETWNRIHAAMEKEHPGLKIVGWYHSHPGFGVGFSDMDKFIQENFFSGRGQVALVTDPLGGDEGMCANTAGGIKQVTRFWVDGRERRCSGASIPAPTRSSAHTVPDDIAKSMKSMEDRVTQTLTALEEFRTSYYRFLLACGMIVALGLALAIGHTIYRSFTLQAPENPAFVPSELKIPVKFNGEWSWVASGLVVTKPSAREQAQMDEFEQRMKEAAEAERAKKEAELQQKPPAPADDGKTKMK